MSWRDPGTQVLDQLDQAPVRPLTEQSESEDFGADGGSLASRVEMDVAESSGDAAFTSPTKIEQDELERVTELNAVETPEEK